MLNGLDLFSGIGGISLVLAPWVRPVAYCEIDRYAKGVLLSRMAEGKLRSAPVWDDVRTLTSKELGGLPIDIIYGGFPCQDISVAGNGAGLEGERSGLFFEIMRLVRELRPAFVFLENVPAIRTRGLDIVLEEFTKERYDCRWTMLSASEVGACHRRERWFMLAHATSPKRERIRSEQGREKSGSSDSGQNTSDTNNLRCGIIRIEGEEKSERKLHCGTSREGSTTNSSRLGLSGCRISSGIGEELPDPCGYGRWTSEPCICRGDHGVSKRVDRIRALGNSVVPLQAQTAFKMLLWGKMWKEK